MNKTAIISGTTFVLAWITGLLIAGGGPTPEAGASDVASYFATHQHAAMVEHFLIDAVAGAALIGLAVTARRLSTAAFAAGLAAAVISLGQAAIGEAMAITASDGSTSTVHGLFVTLNNADTIKIALLAVMIAATALAAHRSGLPAWLDPGQPDLRPRPGGQRPGLPARQHRTVRTALPHPAAAADLDRRVHHRHRPPRPGSSRPAGLHRPGLKP